MARVRLNPYLQRSVETKKLCLGKTILFCEAKTEYNYFAKLQLRGVYDSMNPYTTVHQLVEKLIE